MTPRLRIFLAAASLVAATAALRVPFGRADIAFVYLAAAAASVAILRGPHRTITAVVGATLTLGGISLLKTEPGGLPIGALRAAAAFGLALFAAALLDLPRPRAVLPTVRSAWPSIVVGLAVAILPPWLYAAAVSASLRNRAAEFRSQSRILEAARTLQTLSAVDPAAEIDGRSAHAAAATARREVLRLTRRLATPLSPAASVEERLEAARGHAMLDEPEAAIDLVAPLVAPPKPDPRALELVGKIAQVREEWEESRFWFAAAERTWAANELPDAAAGRSEALAGIGFAERKLGRPREAEAAYRSALVAIPSAENHWQLARFYADSQRASDAATHARTAAKIDPAYAPAADRLTDRLLTHEFGCLPVFTTGLRESPSTRHD